MAITPIDAKTSFVGNNDASRLREIQQAQEAGPALLVTQQQEKAQEKFETVHTTENSEGKVIRQEDESAEKEKEQPDNEKRKKQAASETEKDETPKIPDPDGLRGMKIDIKA